jgi:hypothetical protein
MHMTAVNTIASNGPFRHAPSRIGFDRAQSCWTGVTLGRLRNQSAVIRVVRVIPRLNVIAAGSRSSRFRCKPTSAARVK